MKHMNRILFAVCICAVIIIDHEVTYPIRTQMNSKGIYVLDGKQTTPNYPFNGFRGTLKGYLEPSGVPYASSSTRQPRSSSNVWWDICEARVWSWLVKTIVVPFSLLISVSTRLIMA